MHRKARGVKERDGPGFSDGIPEVPPSSVYTVLVMPRALHTLGSEC